MPETQDRKTVLSRLPRGLMGVVRGLTWAFCEHPGIMQLVEALDLSGSLPLSLFLSLLFFDFFIA